MAAIRKEERVHSLEQPSKKRIVRKKVVKRKNRKALFRARFKNTALLVACIAVSSVLLHRYANISETKYGISDIEGQIYTANLEKDELQIQLNQIKNSDWLKEQAQSKINLRPAKESQVVKVSVDSSK